MRTEKHAAAWKAILLAIEKKQQEPGWNQTRVATLLGVDKSTVNSWLSGKRGGKKASIDEMLSHMQKLEIDPTPYLGDAGRVIATPAMRRTGEHAPVEYVRGPHIVEVGVYGMAEAGTLGIEVFELAPKRLIPILERYYHPDIVTIEVVGDSMLPAIKPGSHVGIIPNKEDLREGAIYLVKLPHFGALLKRVFRGEDGFILKSDNLMYPPQTVPYEDRDGIILGRVVWTWQDV